MGHGRVSGGLVFNAIRQRAECTTNIRLANLKESMKMRLKKITTVLMAAAMCISGLTAVPADANAPASS